jgi:3-deoxy-D-manno-octulosonate 8-phosphate phosphatase (KDO 8-P phosphatase)
LRKLSRKLNVDPRDIELVIFDVDGVMTDNRIWFIDEKVEAKPFSVSDGLAFKVAMTAPSKFAVISARYAKPTEVRCTEIGIGDIYQQRDKQAALEDLLQKHKLDSSQVAHVGNDIPDILLMEQVGIGIFTADAEPDVVDDAHYQTEIAGGKGCCREVSKFFLKAKGLDLLQLYRDIIRDVRSSKRDTA